MNWLWVALLGGAVGLDGASLAQVMISRPLVAATVTGWILGSPGQGAMLGAILEVFSLVVLPVGAARYPEAGTGAVAASAAFVLAAPEPTAGALVLAVVFGLLWEQVTGATVYQLRLLNERLVGGPAAGGLLSASSLERRHLGAMGIDFARAAVVTLAGAFVGTALLRAAVPWWGLGDGGTLGILGVVVTAMLGAVLGVFGGWEERRGPFLAGAALGLALLLL